MKQKRTLSFWLLLCGILKVNGFDLQCTFKTLANPFEYAPRTGSSAFNVNIQGRDQIVTSVNGKDNNHFDGTGYKSLEIRIQPVHFIPQGLGKFFPNLEGLDIDTSQLKEVTKSDLAQFPKLKQVYLYSNFIKSLPADLFEGNPELFSIEVGSNPITHVGRGILNPLKNLETASFCRTYCIEMGAESRPQIASLVSALEISCRNDTIDDMNHEINQKKSTSACDPLNSPIACIEELKRKLESKENCY